MKEIASDLSLCTSTIEAHVYNISRKLDCSGIRGIMAATFKTGLIAREDFADRMDTPKFQENLR